VSRSWSPAAEQKLRELYATESITRLAFLLKRTPTAIKSRAGVLGLSKGNRHPWTAAQDRRLRQRYASETIDTLTQLLGHSASSVYQRARRLGLVKPEGWAAKVTRQRWAEGRNEGSRRRHFPKGHVPANKGLRRPGWAPGRMAETQFKKGAMSGAAQHNYVPIGTEKIDKKRNVLVRKITDGPALFPVNRWRPVHVLVWEAANGPIPPGHICVFRRGMKTYVAAEITADKLEIVTYAENMRRNTIHNLPQPLKDVIQLLGRVKRQARKGTDVEQH
jgi:hypothetical protein